MVILSGTPRTVIPYGVLNISSCIVIAIRYHPHWNHVCHILTTLHDGDGEVGEGKGSMLYPSWYLPAAASCQGGQTSQDFGVSRGPWWHWEQPGRALGRELETEERFKSSWDGTSLVVWWLRLRAPSAGGLGSIPSQGTIYHIPQLRVHKPQLRIPHGATKQF